MDKIVDSDKIYDSFQRAIWPIFWCAQCFGIFPISGLRSSTPNQINFSWTSLRTAYAAIYILFAIFMLTLYTMHIISIGVTAKNFVEHMLFLANAVHNIFIEASICQYNLPDKAKYYFLKQFSQIFKLIPYNILIGLGITWMNFSLTISWNFMDIFAILVSVGLSKRFEQINNRLRNVKGKCVPETYWQQIRLHYVELCEVVEYVEIYISPVVLISCTNDLYFICYQLLNVFDVLPYKINVIYFWYSLFYLIIRTICLFLFTAEINDQAKKPMEILKTIPTFSWCVELDRFIHQTARESICLSGMRFFYLTRKLVLSMIGTVVTYELVLMQFDYKTVLDFKNTTDTSYACDFSYNDFL
uniref:Gustatory receptor n=1 Tax=Lutzomyia longipalpis TaxID=7200 RepID=A0A7G3AWS6_LUTLO